MEADGKLRAIEWRATVARQSAGRTGTGVREYAVTEAWLTREQALLVATQSNTPRAWEITELMVRVFDAVVDRQRAAPAFDGPAMVAMVRALLVEERTALRAEVLREVRAELRAAPANDALPFLDRRAKALVLAPLLTLARLYGAADGPRRVAQERGRLDRKLRDHLGWQRRWCFYPSHELGKLLAWLEVELATAQRVATELARARQLTLAPYPKAPPRGEA